MLGLHVRAPVFRGKCAPCKLEIPGAGEDEGAGEGVPTMVSFIVVQRV